MLALPPNEASNARRKIGKKKSIENASLGEKLLIGSLRVVIQVVILKENEIESRSNSVLKAVFGILGVSEIKQMFDYFGPRERFGSKKIKKIGEKSSCY